MNLQWNQERGKRLVHELEVYVTHIVCEVLYICV